MWIFMLMCCAVLSRSVMSNSLQPHGAIARQAPLVHEDSSGKTTGVGWHALFLPDPGIKPRSPPLWADSFPSELPGKPKNTGVGSLTLLQGNFLTQESNRGLLHCRQILYQLRHQGSPMDRLLPCYFICISPCIFKTSPRSSVAGSSVLTKFC